MVADMVMTILDSHALNAALLGNWALASASAKPA